MFEFGAKFFQLLRLYLILLLTSPMAGWCQMLRPAMATLNPIEEAHANPALPASLKTFTIGIYSERRYLINGLDNYLLSAALPLKRGGLGFSIKYFSSGAFRQSETGIAYAKKLGQVDVGMHFSYHTLSVAGYGKAGAMLVDAGTAWRITDQLRLVAGIYNAGGARLNKMNEKLAYETRCAFGYKVSAQLQLLLEIAKQENKPVNIRAGLQYSPASSIIIYGGIDPAGAGQPYGAFSMQWNNYRVLMSVRFHPQLGPTPGLGLLYINNEKNSEL